MKHKLLICELCKNSYAGRSNLLRHIRMLHNAAKRKYLVCNDCGKKLSRKDSLKRHLMTHVNCERSFTCKECNATFPARTELVRHHRRLHKVRKKNAETDRQIVVCNYCHTSFTSKANLRRHIRRQHEKNGQDGFTCAYCGKVLSRKHNLVRHIETHTGVSIDRTCLKCEYCEAAFSRKYHLERHRRIHEAGKKDSEADENTFTCNECNKTFRRKDTLVVHFKSHTNKKDKADRNFYECTMCLRNFTSERSLLQHIRKQHEHVPDECFECHVCHTKFSCKGSMRRHIITVHAPDKERKLQRRAPRLSCVQCEETFPNRKVLMEHYETSHNIKQQFEYLLFDSLDDFEEWRSPCYVHKTTWVTSVDTCVWRFSCHRSGVYQDSCVKNNRKRQRSLKTIGTKKLQGFCPGEITLRRRLSDGLCLVTLQKTHVGHSIEDISEVRHIRLTQGERDWIARQLTVGVPRAEIEKKVALNFDVEQATNRRLGALTLKDIGNVAATLKPKIPFKKPNDPVHDDVFVSERGNSILYYKKQKERDTKFNAFGNDDFVIVYQTKFQKSILQKYGHKVVAFDGMHGLNSYDLIVHTMLVVDAEDEGFAVAFLVSNRNDQAVINAFVRCVRENAGVIHASTLLSDTSDAYFNAWRNIMGPTEFSSCHMWHVRKMWRENLHKQVNANDQTREHQTRKTAAKERQRLISDLKRQLFDLADESDKTAFGVKLESFLSMNDPGVQPFLEYFRENYANKGNVEKWAACHRSPVVTNVNTHVESFHRTLKYAIAKKKKVGAVAAALHYLELYIKRRTKQYFSKAQQAELTSEQQILRQRHAAAAEEAEKLSLLVQYDADLRVWQVGSFGASSDGVVEMEMYAIQQNETTECANGPEDCPLRCSSCETCAHEYRCSCHDSAVRNNMCQHIHALCLFYQNPDNVFASDDEDAVSDVSAADEVVVIENPSDEIENKYVEPARTSSNSVDEKSGLECLHKNIEEEFDRLKSSILKRVSSTPDSYDRWHMVEKEVLSRVLPAWDLLGKDGNIEV